MNGKGSRPRGGYNDTYRSNFDSIFRGRRTVSFAEIFARFDAARAEKKSKAGRHVCQWEFIGSFGPVKSKNAQRFYECRICGDHKP